MRRNHTLTQGLFGSVALVLIVGTAALGTPQVKKRAGIQPGNAAIVCSATPASGPWAKKYPFNPQTYGKVSGVSPVTSPDPKIVLYTRTLDKRFFQLASAIDVLVARFRTLPWSLVQVMDEKGAQFGGYTVPELSQRITEIEKLATQNHINRLSFAISASNVSMFSPRIGLTDPNNVAIAYVTADDPEGKPIIRWSEKVNTSLLSEKEIQTLVAALEKAILQQSK